MGSGAAAASLPTACQSDVLLIALRGWGRLERHIPATRPSGPSRIRNINAECASRIEEIELAVLVHPGREARKRNAEQADRAAAHFAAVEQVLTGGVEPVGT